MTTVLKLKDAQLLVSRLADPDLPRGISVPRLSPIIPKKLLGYDENKLNGVNRVEAYQRLRQAYKTYPRRELVVLAFRLQEPVLSRTEIAKLFGVGSERIRILENRAIAALVKAWNGNEYSGWKTAQANLPMLRAILLPAYENRPTRRKLPVNSRSLPRRF